VYIRQIKMLNYSEHISS